MPECSVHLAQCVVYLAKCKKSVAVYEAYKKASQDAKKYSDLSVPLHLRNAPTELMRELGYGKDYKYTPKEDSSRQKYFPPELEGRHYLDG
jgi:putative ATPase